MLARYLNVYSAIYSVSVCVYSQAHGYWGVANFYSDVSFSAAFEVTIEVTIF